MNVPGGSGRRAQLTELDRVLAAIRRMVRALRLTARQAESRFGISAAQLFVLHELERSRVGSLGEIAARTHTDQSSVSVVVERLGARGLVRRRHSPSDARRMEVELTPLGRRLARRAPEPAQARLVEALGLLSAKERRTLARALDRLAQRMEPMPSTVGMFFEDETRLGARPRARRARRRAPGGRRARDPAALARRL